MRILLTNDDGITAPGLLAMHRALQSLGEVTVVAPETGQSAMGHGLTLGEPLVTREAHLNGQAIGHSVRGRPADCVKVAMLEFFDGRPDLVVSGINEGPNVGVNVFYSGTVAAAIEAAFYGVPAVAVSLDHRGDPDFDQAAALTVPIIAAARQRGWSPGAILNINVPALEKGTPRGVRLVRQSNSMMWEKFERADDPFGQRLYWLTGGFDTVDEAETDLAALAEHYLTVTPLLVNLTSQADLDILGTWQWPSIDGIEPSR